MVEQSPELTSQQLRIYDEPESTLSEQERVQVYVRVRPQFSQERKEPCALQAIDDSTLVVQDALAGEVGQSREFTFKKVFVPDNG